MRETVLREPLLVPPGQRELSGRFKLAPDFKLGLRTGVDGWTSYGAIGVARAKNLRIVDVEIDASTLDFASADWRVNLVNGLHIDDSSGVTVEHFRARRVPQDAILVKRGVGIEIVDAAAEECFGLLSVVHQGNQDDPGTYRFLPRATRDCSFRELRFRNGRNPLPAGNPYYSILRTGESFGGDALKCTGLLDSEIEDVSTTGETFLTVKLAVCSRVKLRRVVGAGVTNQGAWQWSAAGVVTAPLWPAEAPTSSEDCSITDSILHPRLSLCRFYDDPQRATANAIHLNYPQRTRVERNHLWHEPGWPVCFGAFEGVTATVKDNVFHNVTNVEDTSQAVFVFDSLKEWPSKINADWRTVNRFVTE